jgi:hypothetical protein
VGGYREEMRLGYEDWDFWLSAIERGFTAKPLSEPLFLYRKRRDSMLSGSNKNRELLIARLVQNHPKLYAADTQQRAAKVIEKLSAQTPALS